MADPTPYVREAVYNRDGRMCVSCGARGPLTFQHRQAVGMGGSRMLPIAEEGVTACLDCNTAFEGRLQTKALANGWKAPRWTIASEVPVNYPHTDGGFPRGWSLLVDDQRHPLPEERAIAIMRRIYGDTFDKWRAELA